MPESDTTEILPRTPDGAPTSDGQEPRSPAPTGPALSSGLVLAGRFRLVRHLATGGMGEVFEAFDEVLRIRVALKAFRDRDGRGTDSRRLEREVRLARRVSHPNVLRVFEFFEASDGAPPFLTMEFLEGETLSEHLRRVGRLSPTDALPIIRQLVAGLSAAHAGGVIHRDLKPSNVFLARAVSGSEAIRVVVADFGIARALIVGSSESVETVTGLQVGSPHSMAPEQITSGEIDQRTDVYALGVLLFRVVTGEEPFQAETPLATAVQRLHVPAPSPRSRVTTVPSAWDRTIRACLQKEKQRRPATVLEVLGGLQGGELRRGRALKLGVLAVVTVIAIVVLGIALQRWFIVRPAVRPVAVLPLQIHPFTAGSAWVPEAMEVMLGAELKAANSLRVLDRDSLSPLKAVAEPEGRPDLMDELGRIRSILGGEVAVVGGLTGGAEPTAELRLDVDARDTRTGRVLGSVSETATTATLGTLASRVGSRLRLLLGVGALSPEQVALLQASRPRNQAALRSYSEALGHVQLLESERAVAAFERASQQDPSFLPSRLGLIEMLLDLGRHEVALPMAREALILAEQVSPESRQRAEALLRTAEEDLKGATAIYQRLFDAHPGSVEDLLRLARVAPAEQTLEVIARFRRSSAAAGSDPRLVLEEAVAHLSLHSPAKALDALGQAEARARANGAALLLARIRGLQAEALLVEHGESPEARAALDEAESTFRDLRSVHELCRVLLHKGYMDARAGRSDPAIARFDEVARMEEEIGNFAEAHSALADMAGQQARVGQLRQALETVRRAEHAFELAGDQGFPKELGELGNVEFLGGRLAEARRWFARATARQAAHDLQPAPALGLYLGSLEREEDRPQQAREAWVSIPADSYLALEAASFLAVLDCDEGHTGQGFERLRAAEPLKAASFPNSRALAETAEARCALAVEDVARAEQRARAALGLIAAGTGLNARVQALVVLAQLESALGSAGPALAELRRAAESAREFGSKRSELDARLGLTAAEIRLHPREGRRDALALADEAGRLGFKRIERLARALPADEN